MNRAFAFGAVAVVLAAAAVIAGTAAGLPDTVATHFGRGGRADGWMSRGAYTALMTTLVIVLPLVPWIALGWMPRRWPRSVSVPHRDYWFAPERREATLARLARHGAIMALLCVVVLATVHVEVIAANRRVPPASDPAMPYVAVAIALMIVVFVTGVAISFRRPKDRVR